MITSNLGVINDDLWEVVQPTNAIITINPDGSGGNELYINYDNNTNNNNFAGLVSKEKLYAGTKVVARVRRISIGANATYLGFGNYNPLEPTGLFNGQNLMRIANTTALEVNFNLRDESGQNSSTELSVGNPSAFAVIEIHRISQSHVQVYFDSELEYENTNIDFGDDYSVFFGGYGSFDNNGIIMDYITISEID